MPSEISEIEVFDRPYTLAIVVCRKHGLYGAHNVTTRDKIHDYWL